MDKYFEYLKQMILAFFRNLADWFTNRWYTPFLKWGDYFTEYGDILGFYKEDFGPGGWFFFILFAVLVAILIGGILFLLFWRSRLRARSLI